jgi:hypothetical protein
LKASSDAIDRSFDPVRGSQWPDLLRCRPGDRSNPGLHRNVRDHGCDVPADAGPGALSQQRQIDPSLRIPVHPLHQAASIWFTLMAMTA